MSVSASAVNIGNTRYLLDTSNTPRRYALHRALPDLRRNPLPLSTSPGPSIRFPILALTASHSESRSRSRPEKLPRPVHGSYSGAACLLLLRQCAESPLWRVLIERVRFQLNPATTPWPLNDAAATPAYRASVMTTGKIAKGIAERPSIRFRHADLAAPMSTGTRRAADGFSGCDLDCG